MVRKHDPDAVNLRVRIKGPLLHRLERAATRNHRSLNGEIIDRLERSFANEDIDKVIEKTAEAVVKSIALTDHEDLERLKSAVREIQRSKPAVPEAPDEGGSLGDRVTRAAHEAYARKSAKRGEG